MRRLLKWIVRLVLAACVILAVLIGVYRVVPPVSTLMLARWATFQPVERIWTPLDRISPNLTAAVTMSEDGGFCRNRGVDWGALHEVIGHSGVRGPSRGASTIHMQTAKNLFLWPARSVVRKAMEIPLALALNVAWPKRRVMEIYLNIAEWGPGLFGAQAAARHYFGKDAADLSPREASLLAAALPNPFLRNPAKPSALQRRLAAIVMARVRVTGAALDCLSRPAPSSE